MKKQKEQAEMVERAFWGIYQAEMVKMGDFGERWISVIARAKRPKEVRARSNPLSVAQMLDTHDLPFVQTDCFTAYCRYRSSIPIAMTVIDGRYFIQHCKIVTKKSPFPAISY